MLLIVAANLVAGRAIGENWPRFRGPGGFGQSDTSTIPTRWTENDYDWKVKLPGIGHSSPIVWDDRVVITCGDPESATRYVLCFQTSNGKLLWERRFNSDPHHLHARNSYASSSPVTDGERVYHTWATPEQYVLVALSLADGKQLWRADLGSFQSEHGFGASPIVHDGKVIVANEQLGKGFVAAYDGGTGRLVWKCPRRGEVKTAYATPAVFTTSNGSSQLICDSTAHGVSSIDPQTGRENWSLDVFPMRCVGSPLVAGELIFGSSGTGGNGLAMVAVRPEPDGKSASVAYEIREAAPYVVMPVVAADLVFLWHDRGTVSCRRLASGDLVWQKRIGGTFSGSPVRVGRCLYCISDAGEVVVLAASAKYELVARNDLGEPSRATPAVADGKIFLRTESHLMSLSGRPNQ
jgi:outer membrane protein assembly factor BamB